MFFSFRSPLSMYSLLRVYLVERPGTSVELHILITHLYRGESGECEIICTGEWVGLPIGQREKSDTSMEGVGQRATSASSSLTKCEEEAQGRDEVSSSGLLNTGVAEHSIRTWKYSVKSRVDSTQRSVKQPRGASRWFRSCRSYSRAQ